MKGTACISALKALGDETRLRILRLLSKAALNVNDISAKLEVSHYNVSKHLRILREVGLVECERLGKERHPVKFYFATPHHSWERGTNENTNGLIRQYLRKGQPMTKVNQDQCDLIAEHLNNRPRKRHGYKTPNQCFLRR